MEVKLQQKSINFICCLSLQNINESTKRLTYISVRYLRRFRAIFAQNALLAGFHFEAPGVRSVRSSLRAINRPI
jgi:hypothetical protein